MRLSVTINFTIFHARVSGRMLKHEPYAHGCASLSGRTGYLRYGTVYREPGRPTAI